MKRSLPPLRLQRSPLVYVIAQVRISAVIAIDKYVPSIQEELRHKGFPRFLKNETHEITFGPNGPQVNVVATYEFQNKEGSAGVILAPTFVALHTNQYTNYESFEDSLRTCLDVVNKTVNINLVERLGLRYVDLIRIQEDEDLSDYLQEGLLGLDPAKLRVTRVASRFEFVGRTEVGQLVIRCSQPEPGQFMPPDVANTRLQNGITVKKNESLYLLDLDHYSEETADFETESVLEGMGRLHDNLDLAFRNAVTTTALQRWGQEEAKQ